MVFKRTAEKGNPMSTCSVETSGPTAHYLAQKYGLFVHYAHYAQGKYPVTLNRDGSAPTDLDDLANRFDVAAFVRDVESFGVEYLIFTAWHAGMNLLYPSDCMNRWRRGHCAKRDVIRELIAAMKKTKVRLYLYTHPADGHDFTAEDQSLTGWDDKTGGYERWNRFIGEVYAELTERYGHDVEGYLFDSMWPEQVNRLQLRNTIIARKPDAVLLALIEANECCDFGSKEVPVPSWFDFDGNTATDDPDTWPSYRRLVCMVQGSEWWAAGLGVAKYPPEVLLRYTVLQAGTASESAGVAWAAGPYPEGGWEPGVAEGFCALNALLRPIAESVKGVHASRSFVTQERSCIPDLPWGGVATESTDGRYTYIHVLRPPADRLLHLPIPADGKTFASATLLRNGHRVMLVQDRDGLDLILADGDAWDTLDTVIRLETASTRSVSPGGTGSTPSAVL